MCHLLIRICNQEERAIAGVYNDWKKWKWFNSLHALDLGLCIYVLFKKKKVK